MNRKASAVWKGSLKEGKGTNPEELIAAAHAGCFTMALSAQLSTLNLTAESLSTSATLSLEKLEAGWTVTKIHLEVSGKIPTGTQAAFEAAAASAKANCPISRLLKAEITLDTKFEN
jgi:osmotically inducible protein OsmC